MQTISKSILALILTLGFVQPALASALDGTDQIIRDFNASDEFLAMLNSPDASIRKAGLFYVLGVIEGYGLPRDWERPGGPDHKVCVLEYSATMEDIAKAVRKYYADKPFMLKANMAPLDVVFALDRQYPCKK